jgi:hypothetical protein
VTLGDKPDYVSLQSFLTRRLFAGRGMLLYYDMGEGLTFGDSPRCRQRFFEWLRIFDEVEHTAFTRRAHRAIFTQLAPLLRRFFLPPPRKETRPERGVTLVIGFPEKTRSRRRGVGRERRGTHAPWSL